jgi:DNA repair protein SbcD/Mre11
MGSKILHLADLHLGFAHEFLGDAAEGRAREADLVLDRIATWLVGSEPRDIGAVLIAGDLFQNYDPGDALAERATRALRRITDAGIAVLTVPGNHDEWTYPTGVFRRLASSWPGTLVTSAEPEHVATLDLDGLRVEVASCLFHQGRNRPSAEWNNPLGSPRGPDVKRVGLFHGTVDRIRGKITEGARAFVLDLDHLAGWGLDYLALGHIHKRSDFRAGSCVAHYPGPIEGKNFDDPGSASLSIVDLRGAVATIESVDSRALGIRSREVGRTVIDLVRIVDRAHLEREIASIAPQTAPPPVARIVLRGRAAFPLPMDEIRRALAPRFLHLEIVPDEPGIELGDWESLATQRSLEGIFVRRILEKRATAPPDQTRLWTLAAEEGLHALGRGVE